MLKTHIEERHTEREDASFPCTLCDGMFNSKWYFKNHVRDHHSQLKEICKHFQQGRCKFEEGDCWSSHQETTSSRDNFECHTCREMFSSKNVMMKHRKLNHRAKQCNQFIKGSCNNSEEDCWYMHTKQDFQQAYKNKAPPVKYQTNN